MKSFANLLVLLVYNKVQKWQTSLVIVVDLPLLHFVFKQKIGQICKIGRTDITSLSI